MHSELHRGIKAVLRWIQANMVMLSNTWSLLGTTAVTSGLGFAYWWVSARQYVPEAVGLASATVSIMILLGGISMLGLGTLLITELPRQPDREVSLISTGFVVAAAMGGVIGFLFALLAPSLSAQFAPLRASVLSILLFTVGVGLTSATAVLDQAMIGILRGNLQFWRNTIFSLAKLVLLFVVGLSLFQKTGMTIYTTWVAGTVLSTVLLFGYTLFKRGWQGKAYLPQWQLLRKLGSAALQHHLLNLILQIPPQFLPVLVVLLLSAKVNAWFYVSSMIANFVFVVPYALTMVLHAMGSAQHSSVSKQARLTLGLAFAACLGVDVILFFGARPVLGLFGSTYAEQAAWCLRILLLAVFPDIIKNHYIAFSRIEKRIGRAIWVMLVGGILELAGAIIGGHLYGLIGLCWGWVGALTVESLFMLPLVYRMVRPVQAAQQTPSPETDAETEPIWLMDTLILMAVPQSQTTKRLQGHVPATTLREEEPTQIIDTLMQPTLLPPRSALGSLSTTPEHIGSTNKSATSERQGTDLTHLMYQGSDTAHSNLQPSSSRNENADLAESVDFHPPENTRTRANGFKWPDAMDIILFLLPVLALSLWFTSLQTLSLNAMNDLGLVSVLSPGIIIALGILVISFILTLQRKKFQRSLLALQLVCIILILYATPMLVEHLPTLYVYKMAGYTEYITRTGTVNPYLDFYFDVPGFFVLSAFLTKALGYSTILEYAGWAPVFYNLIYFGPMYIILTSITTNKRLVWLSLLLFYLTNWIGQDTFCPQGLNFFLYLVIIAMLLKWFKIPKKQQVQPGNSASFKQKVQAWLKAPDTASPALEPWQRRGLLCCLIFIFGLVVFSHPLTPFFTLLSVSLLVIFRRCYPFWLPLLMAVMTAAWILIMMRPYLSQHPALIVNSLGNLIGNVPTSITTGKMTGDALYQIVGKIRLYTTGLVWLLAVLGCIKRLRQGHQDITCILLAVSAFPVIIAQSYGGEILMRIYLFTEPFMVFFVAALFCSESPLLVVRTRHTSTPSTSFWRTAAMIAASLLLLGGFFFTRYGDERVTLVSPDEWNAAQYLYQTAPARSAIFTAWDDTPLFFENYEKYNIEGLEDILPDAVIHTNIPNVVQLVGSQEGNSYIIFTQRQQILATAWQGLPTDTMQRLETGLLKTGKFRLIYNGTDAQILQFKGTSNQ